MNNLLDVRRVPVVSENAWGTGKVVYVCLQ